MKYGRVDVTGPDECPPEGNLPGAAGPFDDAAGSNPFPGAADPQTHLRNIFHRMGFDDAEIVALSGAHTIGAPALAIFAVATTAARSVPPAFSFGFMVRLTRAWTAAPPNPRRPRLCRALRHRLAGLRPEEGLRLHRALSDCTRRRQEGHRHGRWPQLDQGVAQVRKHTRTLPPLHPPRPLIKAAQERPHHTI